MKCKTDNGYFIPLNFEDSCGVYATSILKGDDKLNYENLKEELERHINDFLSDENLAHDDWQHDDMILFLKSKGYNFVDNCGLAIEVKV